MAVKYLVEQGKHLPYTDENGKPDHHLMGAAWAALHGGYRGNQYEGPDKESAISKLRGIYKSEGMKCPDEGSMSSGEAIECRAAVEISPIASNEILFLPIGLHDITPVSGGIGRPIKVKVGPESASAIQAQHDALMAKRKRPYFDFNHEDGPASFWPHAYIWRNGEGVIAKGEWSRRGREAVEGKDFRAFSPVFHVDNKRAENGATVVCKENADPNMGGLVNNPAFKDLPLWAKNGESLPSAGATGDNAAKREEQMNEQEIAALRAKQQELEKEVEALKASANDETRQSQAETELRAVHAEIKNAELQAEVEKQATVIRARNKAEAEQAVKAAIQRGAVLPRDTKTQGELIARATADPSFLSIIAGMQGNGAMGSRITGTQQRIQVVSEEPTNVLVELCRLVGLGRKARTSRDKVAASREFAAVYAREASPITAAEKSTRICAVPIEGLEEAIIAADVTDSDLGTLAGTLVTQRTLELLKFSFPSLSMFTTDFTSEQATFNQTIITRTVEIPEVKTYNTSTGWADSDAKTDDVEITLNQHKGVQITFNEQIMASTVRRLFDEQAPAQAYALAKDMVDALYANITDANFPNNSVVTTASFARSSVVDVGIALDLQGVPSALGSRTMLLYPTVFGNLEKDSVLMQLAAFQRPELITNPTPGGTSLVLPVESFSVVKAPNLPTNNANLTGFAGSKSALLIATRLPNDYTRFAPGVSYGDVQTVTDPDLGISVMLVQFVNHTLATGTRRISLMYGTAAGQGNAGHLIKAATGSGSSRTS